MSGFKVATALSTDGRSSRSNLGRPGVTTSCPRLRIAWAKQRPKNPLPPVNRTMLDMSFLPSDPQGSKTRPAAGRKRPSPRASRRALGVRSLRIPQWMLDRQHRQHLDQFADALIEGNLGPETDRAQLAVIDLVIALIGIGAHVRLVQVIV